MVQWRETLGFVQQVRTHRGGGGRPNAYGTRMGGGGVGRCVRGGGGVGCGGPGGGLGSTGWSARASARRAWPKNARKSAVFRSKISRFSATTHT